ncbi:MAG: ABC transporter substrate-binding protein, partial [SAR324 cluster bacterium]
LTPELAESWSWSDGGKQLTFKLRRGVAWHDGRPFTAADVKFTFDLVREALPDKKLRLSPRKLWFDQVASVTTSGDYEVAFRLRRPQPSLLSMLASGYAPIYPAHIEPALQRTQPVGTGPFQFKSYLPDERLDLVRNPNYFVKGRPYLGGISHLLVRDRQARYSALIAGQVDMLSPGDGSPTLRDQVQSQRPQLVVRVLAQGAFYNIILNTRKPPFDNAALRSAVNYALDRNGFLKTQRGGAVASGALVPPPYSPWGLPRETLAKLPGYGDPASDKAVARKLLADAGYPPAAPLKVVVSTRSLAMFQDMASWVVGELKSVGIEAILEVVETGIWYPRLARRDFQMAANVSGAAPDDPDGTFFEHYACGSLRNYSGYCNQDREAEMVRASEEQNPARRLEMMRELDRTFQLDGSRAILGHSLDYQVFWPHVRGFVPHNNVYNYGRLQDVWLER